MPKSTASSTAHTPTNEAAKRKIIDAAMKLFEEKGTENTSMLEIAKEAGISRKTLYRVFDRPTMIEEILESLMYDISKKIRLKIKNYDDIEEALIEGTIKSVAASRKDKLFTTIIKNETNHRMELFLLRGSEPLKRDLYNMWAPALEKGRTENKVREHLSNTRIAELIMNTCSLLLMRDDFTRKEQRELVKDLLVPAIIKI